MSKQEKLLRKLANANKMFAWTDLVTLLYQLGFEKVERAGSRVVFIHTETEYTIYLHKPHPENNIKGRALKEIKRHLADRGDL